MQTQISPITNPIPEGYCLFRCETLVDALNGYLRERQRGSSGWSVGAWARRLGVASTATLVNILKGRKLPSEDLLERISLSMNLDREEDEYLRLLAESERRRDTRDPHVARLVDRNLRALRLQSDTRVLSLDQLHFFSDPRAYHVAELVNFPDFREDPDWIIARLRAKATRAEIVDLLQGLILHGVLRRREDGRLAHTARYFDSPRGIRNESARRFHATSLAAAAEGIRAVAVERRHFGADVLPVDPKRVPEMKEFLERVRKEFVAQFAAPGAANGEVYQLNLNFLPVTRSGDPE